VLEGGGTTKCFEKTSFINFRRSLRYGLARLWTATLFRLTKMGICRPKLFEKQD
jgi:hypothetical protein